MKGWSNLGAVDTIYEEDEDDDDISGISSIEEEEDSISPNSLSFSSPSESTTPLHSIVEAWTLATGLEPNANIRVHATLFRLHKVPLTSRSSYLKRHLTASSDIILSPPLNITADTFRLVAEFCYGVHVTITPSNVIALRTAADLLELNDGDGSNGLRIAAEANFRRFLTARSGEHVAVLFRTSLDLLPESETAAACVSRCAEVICEMEEDEVEAYLEYVVTVGVGEFLVMVESMQIRLSNHDLLYRMVDIYLQEHGGKVGEEDKSHISSCVDCTKLSPDLLIHAVQNPRMPLRFAIRAMLVEQLRTRHTVLRATNSAGSLHRLPKQQQPPPPAKIVSDIIPADETTLGGILHRDAALKQSVQLRAAMTATRSRIQSLEAELSGMKQLLLSDSGSREAASKGGGGSIMEESGSKRSRSFHYGSSMESSKIERGERRSASSLSCRFTNEYREEAITRLKMETPSPTRVVVKKSLGQRFISGLRKLAFPKVSKVDNAAAAGIINNK